MRVSILIAAYQMSQTLTRAVASVQKQNHTDWELIVVDDASTDGTEELIQRLSADGLSLRYERAEKNRGISATRNRLIELAKGEAFAFLDADDWWSEDHLSSGIALLLSGADLVVAGVETFDLSSKASLGEFYPPRILEFDPQVALLADSVIITSSSVLLTRAIVEKVGLFDVDFRIGEDRDYWLRAGLAEARMRIQRTATCHYAKHPSSTMAQTHVVTAQTIRFYEKYRWVAALPSRLRRKMLAQSLVNQARIQRRRNPAKSLRQLGQALTLDPIGGFGLIRRVLSP